jgi:putative ABC transport system ATP-binding protein
MALVEIRNVTKRYHKGGETITPLDDVSLDIDDGEFVSLMGASGTGKSTLLNLIASIDHADAGTITVNGVDITKLSRTQLANWRAANIGYIFQTHNLIPVLSAYENIELPLLLLPMNRSERQKRVEIALQTSGGRPLGSNGPLSTAAFRRTGAACRGGPGNCRASEAGRRR